MFQRGFKTRCEQTAASLRRQYAIPPTGALDPRLVAQRLRIAVLTPQEIPGLSAQTCERLLTVHRDVWSAVTIPSAPPLIVVNPTHKLGRQNNDLMHELAHLLLEHAAAMTFIDPKTSLMLRSYDAAQEEEANWLSGCLLLPREALVKIKRLGVADDLAAAEYGVSTAMLRYRMNVSGVNIQYQRVQKGAGGRIRTSRVDS